MNPARGSGRCRNGSAPREMIMRRAGVAISEFRPFGVMQLNSGSRRQNCPGGSRIPKGTRGNRKGYSATSRPQRGGAGYNNKARQTSTGAEQAGWPPTTALRVNRKLGIVPASISAGNACLRLAEASRARYASPAYESARPALPDHRLASMEPADSLRWPVAAMPTTGVCEARDCFFGIIRQAQCRGSTRHGRRRGRGSVSGAVAILD